MPRKYVGFNIYKVTLNSVIKYIGITSKTLKERTSDHYYEAFKRNSHYVFHKAIRKYVDSLIFETIDNVDSWEKAQELEIKYIQQFETHITKNGYNSTFGGEGNFGLKMSEEQKRKISESKKGKCSKENHPMWGKTHSVESRKKISEGHMGKPAKHRWVPVVDESGNKYESVTHASKATGIKRTTVNRSALKGRPLSNGKQFFYVKGELFQSN